MELTFAIRPCGTVTGALDVTTLSGASYAELVGRAFTLAGGSSRIAWMHLDRRQ